MMNLKRFRHIGTLLILALIFAIIPVSGTVYADTVVRIGKDNNILAKLSADGKTLTISSSGLGSIPANAFSSNKPLAFGDKLAGITTINIEDNIVEVEHDAFTGCTGLRTLNLKSKSLKAIYYYAFVNSTRLVSVDIPESVTFVQDGAFPKNTILNCPKDFSSTGAQGYEVRETLGFNVTVKESMAFDLFNLINKERKLNNLPTFRGMHIEMTDAAIDRATEDAVLYEGTKTISSHIRTNGNLYYSIYAPIIAEVSTATSKSTTEVYKSLISKEKSIILNSNYLSVGIGCVQSQGMSFWVLCFSSGKDTRTNHYFEASRGDNSTGKIVPLPPGSNTVRINNNAYNLNFRLNATNIKLGLVEDSGSAQVKQETYQSRLGIGGITFAANSGGWSSEKKEIASVSGTGLVKAEGLGTTKIWASSQRTVGKPSKFVGSPTTGTKRASLTVTVFEKIRLWGDTRVDTSLRGAEKYMKLLGVSKLDRIIVAYAGNFPDALAGTYLGVVKDAPIVLVYGGVENKVVDWFKSHVNKNAKIWILGGTGVIASSFDNKLYAAGYKKDEKYVKRLWGQTRFDTNIEILKEAGVNGKDMIVCRGDDYRDSLSASSAARPILLIPKTGVLTKAHRDFLSSIKTSGNCYIIGGTGAVGGPAESQLSPYFNNIKRLWGNTAYDTGRKVSEEFFGKKLESVMVVYSKNFPDGLSGGPIAYKYGAPVLLAADETFRNKEGKTVKGYDMAVDYTKSVGARRVIIMGGTSVIPEKIADAVTKW